MRGRRPRGASLRFLSWVLHYLVRRDPKRAKLMAAQLPITTRLRLALGFEGTYGSQFAILRAILKDDAPAFIRRTSSRSSRGKPSPKNIDKPQSETVNRFQDPETLDREKSRKQASVSAILAAANANRQAQRPIGSSVKLAASVTPLHLYQGDNFRWVDRLRAPKNFDVWQKVGMSKPATPRRL